MSKELIAVLASLDVEDDDQWTTEGLPMLNVVNERLGKTVSRAQVTEVAKSFSRKTPTLDLVAPSNPNGAPAKNEGSADDTEDGAGASSETETETQDDKGDTEESELALAVLNMKSAKKRLASAQAAMDAVIKVREADSATTNAQEIKRFQKSQHAQRVQNADRNKRLSDFLKSTDLK